LLGCSIAAILLYPGSKRMSQRLLQQLFRRSASYESLEPVYADATEGQVLGDLGTYGRWSKIEIAFEGPNTAVIDAQTNPFTIIVDVEFVGPDGKRQLVPAFYDGDGEGGLSGRVWKVRFSADSVGSWTFSTRSSHKLLSGYEGSFEVTQPEKCPDNRSLVCKGRLQYVDGNHYLRFGDNEYWVKGGIDDPENFLGTAFGDWSDKREAIGFLARAGVNSIYVITNNINPGDRNDTWPWWGETPSEAKKNSDRFNISKLQEWEEFFTFVQEQGIVLHIILDDDSAWHNYDHYAYYREMVARFGHHPGIIWNIGEEANENYRDAAQVELATMLKEIDPYDHPVTVHRKPRWPFFGNPVFDLASIQPGDGAANFTTVDLPDYFQFVAENRQLSVQEGHPIPIMIDETPRVTAVNEATRLKMRREVLYPIFLAGGNYELHFRDAYGQQGQLTIEDLSPMLVDMMRARQLVERLPFHEMEPCQALVGEGNYCFGKRDEVYTIYMPEGGTTRLDLSESSSHFTVEWYNPSVDVYVPDSSVQGGEILTFAAPFSGDAALILRLKGSQC
jgi:hypothetical protein